MNESARFGPIHRHAFLLIAPDLTSEVDEPSTALADDVAEPDGRRVSSMDRSGPSAEVA